ncbi:MAG: FAD-dependent monooxygenase [Candidatus Puniceispirillales bacterium]
MTGQNHHSDNRQLMGHGIHIVGGGLTGYAAALTLAQAGFPTHLYQPDVPADDTLRTTTINPTAYDMLDQLGIIERLPDDALTPIQQIIVTDDAERTNPLDAIMSWGNDKKNDDTDAPLAWVIGNAVLVRAMRNMIAKNDHITLHQLAITGYQPRHPEYDHAAAALITADDTVIPASLIIAADGRNSPLRQFAGIRHITRNLGQTAIVSQIKMTDPHHHRAWQRFLAGGPIALMPMADPYMSSLVWSMTNEDASRLMNADDSRFAMALDDATGLAFGRITDIGERQAFPVIPTHAVWPVAGRLVLIGDAAHAINPLAGQGYNLALADIKTLARLLITAQHDGIDIGSGYLLNRYAIARTPEVTAMTLATDGLNMLFSFGKKRRRLAGMGMALANMPKVKALAEYMASGRLFGR